jgi:hypothetical protein
MPPAVARLLLIDICDAQSSFSAQEWAITATRAAIQRRIRLTTPTTPTLSGTTSAKPGSRIEARPSAAL